MRSKLVCICLLFIAFHVAAQKEWKKGYVVQSNGDSLKGEILFEDWDKSPTDFSFRQSDGQTIQKFSTDNINSFSLLSPKVEYVSKPIKIQYYSKEPIGEGKSAIIKEFTGKAFLEVSLRGAFIVLYSYVDEAGTERIFLEKEDQLTELININYARYQNSSSVTYRISRPVYKTQLKQLLHECPTLKTAGLAYNLKDITRLLEDYLGFCNANYQTTFAQENNHDVIDIGVTVGSNQKAFPLYEGLVMQIRSRKNFHNQFALIEIGLTQVAANNPYTYYGLATSNALYFGLYGGTYFGAKKIRPCVFTGVSSLNGFLDTGMGIAYQQKFILSVSSGLFYLTDPQKQNLSIKLRFFF